MGHVLSVKNRSKSQDEILLEKLEHQSQDLKMSRATIDALHFTVNSLTLKILKLEAVILAFESPSGGAV